MPVGVESASGISGSLEDETMGTFNVLLHRTKGTSFLRESFYQAAARASASVANYCDQVHDFEAASVWKLREKRFLEKAQAHTRSKLN